MVLRAFLLHEKKRVDRIYKRCNTRFSGSAKGSPLGEGRAVSLTAF